MYHFWTVCLLVLNGFRAKNSKQWFAGEYNPRFYIILCVHCLFKCFFSWRLCLDAATWTFYFASTLSLFSFSLLSFLCKWLETKGFSFPLLFFLIGLPYALYLGQITGLEARRPEFSSRSVINLSCAVAGGALLWSSVCSGTLFVITEPRPESRLEFLSSGPQSSASSILHTTSISCTNEFMYTEILRTSSSAYC